MTNRFALARAPWGVAVIGCGYWGPNHIRNFGRHPDFEVRMVCDTSEARLKAVARDFHVPEAVSDADAVMRDPDIDLVVVATPTWSHYDVAKAAILAGKHVLVMKPLAGRLDQAEELVDLAERQGVMLAVDHTFLFTGAVRRMREMIDSGALGDLYYIDSVRINLGLFQSDVNVVWDLAAHDVSIIDHLVGGQLPHLVSAVGAAHAGSPTENVAYVTLRYGESMLAQIHVNWLAPAKVRRTIVGGSKRMVIYDDMEPSEKLRVYDKGVTISNSEPLVGDSHAVNGNGSHHDSGNGREAAGNGGQLQRRYRQMVSYRSGDMFVPRIDDREALANEVDDIARCLREGGRPTCDGADGLRTVRVLDAAQRSMIASSVPVAPSGMHGPSEVPGIDLRRSLGGSQPLVRIPVARSGAEAKRPEPSAT